MINYKINSEKSNGKTKESINVEIILGEGGVSRRVNPGFGKVEFFGLKGKCEVGGKVRRERTNGDCVSIEFKSVKDLDSLISHLFKVREEMTK